MESRTGVYYQAMPAVGPDGKNVMKLIPVQKVNGKFVPTQAVDTRVNCQPPVYSEPSHLPPMTLLQNKLPTLEPISDGRFVLKTGPVSNTLSNSVKRQHQVTNNLPLASKLTPNALQLNLQNSSKAATLQPQPAKLQAQPHIFPNGHYLQIPSNATVRTFPASALPQSIKTQIYSSSNIPSNPAKGLPTVVYVSPVNSLKLGPNQQLTGLTKASELPQTLGPHTLSTNTEKKLNSSTAGPKAAQGVTTPMKWVVQEGIGNGAPCLIPVTSPNMTSDLLKAVKHMETVRTTNKTQAGEPTSAPATQEKITPGKDNALVMCNGKVYFVAKKNSEINKDMISAAGNKLIVRNSIQPSSGPCVDSTTAPKQDPKSTLSNKKPNEIIDLCDDDDESFGCAGSGGLTVGDKDEDSNVIFVSYIPPKSDTDTSKKVAENSAPQNGHNEDKHSDAENVEESCERNSTSSPVIVLDVSTCEDKADASESANGAEEEEVRSQEVSEKVAEVSFVQPRPSHEDRAETSLERPALEEKPQQKSDSELRRIFGITSDLRIRLQKMNQVKEQISDAERKTINKCTLEGIRKRIQASQIELKIKQLIQSKISVSKEDDGPTDAKIPRLEQDGQKHVDTSSPQPKDAVSCDEEMRSESTGVCTDGGAVLCCPGPEEETPSTSGSTEVTEQNAEPLGSSSSSASSFQPLETQTEKNNADSTLSISRKTPARQSKGSGRLCTACPCGTKVGVMPAIPSPKPQEKPNSVVHSPEQAKDLTESKRDCSPVDAVPENSVSNPEASSDVSDTPGDERAHTDQSNVKPGKGSLQKRASHTTQIEAVSEPDLSLKEKTCSSFTSPNDAEGKTCENGTGGPAAPTTTQEPNSPTELKVKAPASSFPKTLPRDTGKGPTEFYSSIMLDPEEVERRQRINRLKDLLKQKEAALEKLRKSM